MRSMRKWNYLQILLAVVIAFSGICTYSTDTYSLFCYGNDYVQNSIVQSLDSTQLQPDVCDAEQLGSLNARGMIEQIAQNSRLNVKSLRLRSHSKRALSVLAGTFLSGESRYYYQSARMGGGYVFVHSAWVIIEYIHHQDGAKG